MKGYVKTNFQKITKSGYSSYGSAVVANDGYMLELRVTQYLPNADIHVGDLLKITGTIRDIVGKYFLWKNINYIINHVMYSTIFFNIIVF